MYTLVLLLGLTAGSATVAAECRNPPSRVSPSYWDYIDTCGCAKLDPPSRASEDHGRFLKACSEWRERNPKVEVTVPATATPSP